MPFRPLPFSEVQKKDLINWLREKNAHYAGSQFRKVYRLVPPIATTIIDIARRYEEFGEASLKEDFKRPTRRHLELINKIREAYETNPELPISEVAKRFKTSKGTILKIAKEEKIEIQVIKKKRLKNNPIPHGQRVPHRLKAINEFRKEEGLEELPEKVVDDEERIFVVENPKVPESGQNVDTEVSKTDEEVDNEISESDEVDNEIPETDEEVDNEIPESDEKVDNKIPETDQNVDTASPVVTDTIIQDLVSKDWLQESLKKLFGTSSRNVEPRTVKNSELKKKSLPYPQTYSARQKLSNPKPPTEAIAPQNPKGKKAGKSKIPRKPKINFESMRSLLKRNSLANRPQPEQDTDGEQGSINSNKKPKTTTQDDSDISEVDDHEQETGDDFSHAQQMDVETEEIYDILEIDGREVLALTEFRDQNEIQNSSGVHIGVSESTTSAVPRGREIGIGKSKAKHKGKRKTRRDSSSSDDELLDVN